MTSKDYLLSTTRMSSSGDKNNNRVVCYEKKNLDRTSLDYSPNSMAKDYLPLMDSVSPSGDKNN